MATTTEHAEPPDTTASDPAPLSPDEIAAQTFPRVRRGYAEKPVQELLALVAQELREASAREGELARRLEELESAPPDPSALSREQLIAALGAQADAVLEQRARQAQVRMAEARARAEIEVRAELDVARARAREIVVEAEAARDRMHAQLESEREQLEAKRARLEADIAVLEQGRDRLLEIYRRVRQAVGVSETTDTKEENEAPPPPPTDTPPPERDDTDPGLRLIPPARPEPSPAAAETPPAETPPAGSPPVDDGVHQLFARLETEVTRPRKKSAPRRARRDKEQNVGAPPPGEAPARAATEREARRVTAVDEAPEDAPADAAESDTGPVDPAIAERDLVLAPLATALARDAKRALQDEQNALLDALRRRRASSDLLAVVPALDEHTQAWSEILRPALDRAYVAAYLAKAPAKSPESRLPDGAPPALVGELTHSVVVPLRERVIGALRGTSDTEGLGPSVSSRYREWRGQYLEPALIDALAVAYARGVYDGSPSGSMLRWVPNQVGQCPDADDNALEPTRRGGRFPTGQQYPPAHPGCRCALAVVDEGDDGDGARAKPRAINA